MNVNMYFLTDNQRREIPPVRVPLELLLNNLLNKVWPSFAAVKTAKWP